MWTSWLLLPTERLISVAGLEVAEEETKRSAIAFAAQTLMLTSVSFLRFSRPLSVDVSVKHTTPTVINECPCNVLSAEQVKGDARWSFQYCERAPKWLVEREERRPPFRQGELDVHYIFVLFLPLQIFDFDWQTLRQKKELGTLLNSIWCSGGNDGQIFCKCMFVLLTSFAYLKVVPFFCVLGCCFDVQ